MSEGCEIGFRLEIRITIINANGEILKNDLSGNGYIYKKDSK